MKWTVCASKMTVYEVCKREDVYALCKETVATAGLPCQTEWARSHGRSKFYYVCARNHNKQYIIVNRFWNVKFCKWLFFFKIVKSANLTTLKIVMENITYVNLQRIHWKQEISIRFIYYVEWLYSQQNVSINRRSVL